MTTPDPGQQPYQVPHVPGQPPPQQYPPQQYGPAPQQWGPPPAQYGQPPAPPKKRSTLRLVLIIGAILAALCGGGAIACVALVGGAANQIDNENTSKRGDVTVNGCKHTPEIGAVEVTYTVKNSSTRARTYIVDFDIMSGATRVGEAHGIITDLAGGQTANDTAIGSVTGSGQVTCVLSGVS